MWMLLILHCMGDWQKTGLITPSGSLPRKLYITLGVVGVERSTSETARRTSKGRKIGAWCICDAPNLGRVFVQRRRTRQMARPEGPSRCFGFGSFVQERWSSGEARRAGPRSPLSWRLIKNAKFQLSSSRHRVFPRELIRHSVVDCPLCFAANHITAF